MSKKLLKFSFLITVQICVLVVGPESFAFTGEIGKESICRAKALNESLARTQYAAISVEPEALEWTIFYVSLLGGTKIGGAKIGYKMAYKDAAGKEFLLKADIRTDEIWDVDKATGLRKKTGITCRVENVKIWNDGLLPRVWLDSESDDLIFDLSGYQEANPASSDVSIKTLTDLDLPSSTAAINVPSAKAR